MYQATAAVFRWLDQPASLDSPGEKELRPRGRPGPSVLSCGVSRWRWLKVEEALRYLIKRAMPFLSNHSMTSFLSASVISWLKYQNFLTNERCLAVLLPLSYLSLPFSSLCCPDLLNFLQVKKLWDSPKTTRHLEVTYPAQCLGLSTDTSNLSSWPMSSTTTGPTWQRKSLKKFHRFWFMPLLKPFLLI